MGVLIGVCALAVAGTASYSPGQQGWLDQLRLYSKAEQVNLVMVVPEWKAPDLPVRACGESGLFALASATGQRYIPGETSFIVPGRDPEAKDRVLAWVSGLDDQTLAELAGDGVKLTELPTDVRRDVWGTSLNASSHLRELMEKSSVARLQFELGLRMSFSDKEGFIKSHYALPGVELMRQVDQALAVASEVSEGTPVNNRREGEFDFGDGEIHTMEDLVRMLKEKTGKGIDSRNYVAETKVFLSGGYSAGEFRNAVVTLMSQQPRREVGVSGMSALAFLKAHPNLYSEALKKEFKSEMVPVLWDQEFPADEVGFLVRRFGQVEPWKKRGFQGVRVRFEPELRMGINYGGKLEGGTRQVISSRVFTFPSETR